MTRSPLRRLALAPLLACAVLMACGSDSGGADLGGALADAELPSLPPDSTVFVPTDTGTAPDTVSAGDGAPMDDAVAVPDAVPDGGVGPDAVPDAVADATPDGEVIADATPDAVVVPDAVPDAAPDTVVTPDATPDTTPDTVSTPCGSCPATTPFCKDGACVCSGVSCGAGAFCVAGVCQKCSVDTHCGANCTNCAGVGQICNPAGTMCVACSASAPCDSGFICQSGSCSPCNSAGACGPECQACSGDTPSCIGGNCVCSSSSCPGGTWCANLKCETCDTDSHCGAGCTDCTATSQPVCSQGQCRCTADVQCGPGAWCSDGACKPCGDGDPNHCGASCAACGGGTPYCVGGSCQCGTSEDCGPGKHCENGACLPCDEGAHCGADCVPCPEATPVCENAQCVACIDGTDCGGGTWCQSGLCVPCGADDPQHCGASCAVCGGKTPACISGKCTCSGASCGAGAECLLGGCVACDTEAACGPTCQPCAGAKPYCASHTTGCVACLIDTHCPTNQHCASGACVPNCSPSGCANNLGLDGKTCATAKVVGRTEAMSGYSLDTEMTSKFGNNDDLDSTKGKCFDAKYDAHWRVWLFAGETVFASMTNVDSEYDPMMKLYRGSVCAPNEDTDLVGCYQQNFNGGSESLTHVATVDGWYTIVTDGRSAGDKGVGAYTMTIKITCKDAGCCCQ